MYPTKKLSEICKIIGGGTPSKSNSQYYNGDILWASVRDMKDEFLENTELKISEEAVRESSTHIIPAGNVIIATRVGLGKVCLNKFSTAINQDLKGVLPKDTKNIGINYLFWWFKSISRKLESAGTGATVKGVKVDFIENLEIPLPPLSTQSRIVARLNSAFASIDEQVSLLRENIRDVENMRKSVLYDIFSDNYPIKKLSEICKFQNGFAFKSSLFRESGQPIIRISNIQDNNISYEKLVYFNLEEYKEDLSKYIVKKGDLVIAMSGATTGKIAINQNDDVFYLNQRVGLFLFENEITKIYTHYFLGTKIQENLKQSVGSAIPNLSSEQIKNIQIPLPPLPRQHEIVTHLDRVFTTTEALRGEYEAQIRDLETLKQSLLEEAFAGRLVQENEA